MKINKLGNRGFTIIELLVVIIVIAVLASLTFVLYAGVQTKLIDASISADAESMNSSELLYKLSHSTIAKAYYSGNGPDSELNFSPKTGNIIDVVTSGKEFCIRVYNPNGTKNSIHNAYQVESSSGMCTQLPPSDEAAAVPVTPAAPVVTIALVGSNIVATITPVTCLSGSAQYSINDRTNDGSWSGYTAWSTSTNASQNAVEGVKYGYQAQARCYISYNSLASDPATGIEVTYTNLFAPAAPDTSVALIVSDAVATVTPVSCLSGTIQYGINSRTNDGSWSGYTSWSSTTTASQAAAEGVKYGYQAQARCYTSDNELSAVVTGSEGTYIRPIAIPTTPTVTAVTSASDTTTYSWGAISCVPGASVRYQYRLTVTPSGFDSDWVATTAISVPFTTSTGGETYSLQVQSQCYNANTSSNWSASGSASYYCVEDALPIATSISGYWTTAPFGYLLEDGSAVSRTTYADLFVAIGTTYGTGDGSTTFNLPDSRGRTIVNKSPTDTEFDVMGEKFGEKAHTLTSSESGEQGHNHLQNAHGHASTVQNWYGNRWATSWASSGPGIDVLIGLHDASVADATATNIAVSASDASTAHNTVQPSIVQVFAIKYRPATASVSMLSPATSISGYFTTAPSGYLLEDGSAVSRTTYSDLFAVIGTTYGTGDGSTTFNLPDSRGRVMVNKNPSDTEFDVMGEKYGEKTHTDTGTESGIKGHNHTQNSHGHTTTAQKWYGTRYATSWASSGPGIDVTIGSHDASVGNATATNQAVASSNASSAHNTIQPSIVQTSAIKYTPASGSIDALSKGTSIQGYWVTAPSGYIFEDGTAISRATYSALFSAIGTTYGTGDGSTTFNLPDSRGRVAVNKNPSDTEFDVIGEKYGEKAHTLTGAESGEKGHNHTQNVHGHTTTGQNWYGNRWATAWSSSGPGIDVTIGYNAASITDATATNIAIANTNASSAHNNIQPSMVENFAIRY